MSTSPKKDAPFSLRLSSHERDLLNQWSGDLSGGEYIRRVVFDEARDQRCYRRTPVKDHAVLAKVLGELGRGQIANNLNQLAKAAHAGYVPLLVEAKPMLLSACADIRLIRQQLLQALGQSGDP